MEEARAAEREIGQGRYRGPLHGVPVAVKDQYDVAGAPAAVRIPQPAGPGEDSTAVRRLREAGAVLLGKLNMSGLPGGVPAARNPWNLDHVPGGSSTGSGAGIAAGAVHGLAGGGHRGVDPEPRLLFRHTRAEAHLRTGQPVRPGAAGLVAGHRGAHDPGGGGPRAHASGARRVRPQGPHLQSGGGVRLQRGPAGRGLGPGGRRPAGVHEAHRDRPRSAAMPGRGVGRAGIPGSQGPGTWRSPAWSSPPSPTASSTPASSTTSAGPTWPRRCRARLPSPAGRACSWARCPPAATTSRPQRMRSRLRRELSQVFREVHVMALPTNPTPAPRAGELDGLDAVYKMLRPDFVSPANLAGIPALAIPCGFHSKGLPVGMQLWGKGVRGVHGAARGLRLPAARPVARAPAAGVGTGTAARRHGRLQHLRMLPLIASRDPVPTASPSPSRTCGLVSWRPALPGRRVCCVRADAPMAAPRSGRGRWPRQGCRGRRPASGIRHTASGRSLGGR